MGKIEVAMLGPGAVFVVRRTVWCIMGGVMMISVIVSMIMTNTVIINRMPHVIEMDMLAGSAQSGSERVGDGRAHDTHKQQQGQYYTHGPIIGF